MLVEQVDGYRLPRPMVNDYKDIPTQNDAPHIGTCSFIYQLNRMVETSSGLTYRGTVKMKLIFRQLMTPYTLLAQSYTCYSMPSIPQLEFVVPRRVALTSDSTDSSDSAGRDVGHQNRSEAIENRWGTRDE